MTNQNHPFHLVTFSPWPILISINLFNNFIYIINWFYSFNYFMMFTLLSTLLCMYQWWRDITREATYQGNHTNYVYKGIRMGMMLFIISEILFFFSFFWAFFHSSLTPNVEIGQLWPPMGIKPFNPFDIPLMNTIILISSGMTVTWSHHAMINMNLNETMKSLILTIMLGLYFSGLQLIEYIEAPFTIADSTYGSTFFIATGFHGIHVMIGSMFLFFCYMRMKNLHFSPIHHFGFEAAAWYWHFVDVIWLFLYMSIYWWTF
uniref:Cytochrome c oxidase subunit 3 n=1 Tax=Pristomyrmex punctatus TaxID=507543 RepID=E5RPZ9_9HYME|nr:cytochrome c oxidase subunit III [Pristomyrmex punctatus]BAJ53352.1 cytochrome oxidase subunit III [Pristomyrmex punctatus]BAJ53365.1 cytochrome oxidase subunit III [Pristomyrmex punctatus]